MFYDNTEDGVVLFPLSPIFGKKLRKYEYNMKMVEEKIYPRVGCSHRCRGGVQPPQLYRRSPVAAQVRAALSSPQ